MNWIRKRFRSGLVLVSHWLWSSSKRRVKHVLLRNYQLLVFANEAVGRHIWMFKSFEPDETLFFENNVKPGDVCFDVGGNVGYFSMLMAERASAGSVHVFEPIPVNASMINASMRLNRFENIAVNNVAVGSETGNVNFSVSTDSAYSSIKATGRFAETENILVPVLRLDDYVVDNNISRVDIMKVDVEGAEEMVIAGAQKLLTSNLARPRLVLLELFDQNLKPFGTDVLSLVQKMVGFGYEPHVLNADGSLQAFSSDKANVFPNIIFKANAG